MKLTVFLLLLPAFAVAQLNSDQQSMLQAEYAFADAAKNSGTPAAFIQFLSDDAITFGQDLRVGTSHYQSQKNDGSWLSWEPVYSDISASGDFGFNTGPWELREKNSDPAPVAYGQFLSIWKRMNGEWKVVLDVGVSHEKPASKDSLEISKIDLRKNPAGVPSVMQRVVAEEQKFIQHYNSKKVHAFHSTLSSEARVLRHNTFPKKASELGHSEAPAAYRYLGGDISASGDMAYVYGKALIDVVEKGVRKPVDANYVRVWKKEDGKTWKIVADVITYL
jgi:ketosteroid isomerase-like protein